MCMAAVDVDLGEHRKRHVEFGLTKCLDRLGIARFLRAELVAGKAQNRKAAGRQSSMQFFEALILRRESASARGVDDQEHLTLKPPERNLLAGQRLGREIINA